MTLANRRPGASLFMYEVALKTGAVVADTKSPEDLPGPVAEAIRRNCRPWWKRWGRESWLVALLCDLERRKIGGYQAHKNAMFARLRQAGVQALKNGEINWVHGELRHYGDDYGGTTTMLLDPRAATIERCHAL